MLSSGFRPLSRDIELVEPPSDSISKIEFCPTQDLLAVGSWDNGVRVYQVSREGNSQASHMYSHKAPVLDLTWSPDGSKIMSSGCDNVVQLHDVKTKETMEIGSHEAPIKCCKFLDEGNWMLVTAGWDKKLKYWDLRLPTQSRQVGQVDLSEKAYCMDLVGKLMVVATANRRINVFNLSDPLRIWKEIESPLKWQTKSVACFPTGDSYAIGSIEGRVAIQYPGEKDDKKNYSFKCHRYGYPEAKTAGPPVTEHSQEVFAVNTITFHKAHGTFCTGGADGSMTIWDGIGRSKIKTFSCKDLNNGNTEGSARIWGTPIVSTAFSYTQELFAYAMSYDWSRGHTGVPPQGQNVTKIMLHQLKLEEVKKKDGALAPR